MLLRFWKEELGGIGTPVREFTVSRRRIDGVVLPDEKPDGKMVDGREVAVSLKGKDVILVEVKRNLGRYFMGPGDLCHRIGKAA